MKTRLIFPALQFWLLALAPWLPAAPLRVTTWDLQPGVASGADGSSNLFQRNLVQEAAESLKKLHPDVILLQHVADWQTCHQLAQALQPETYQVATCSSWRDTGGKNPPRQVAILSKTRAWLSWSEPWQSGAASPAAPGGFAFAAIKSGDKSIGVFSVQLGEVALPGREDSRDAAMPQTGEESSRQLAGQIALLQNWKTNRPQACIVAGDFDSTADGLRLVREKIFSRLEQLGFENALAALPPDKPAALAFMFDKNAGLVSSPLLSQTAHFENDSVTCGMDLAAPAAKSAPAPLATRVGLPPAKPAATLANATTPAGSPQTLLWIAGFLAGCLVFFALVRKKVKTGAKMSNLHAGQIIIAPPSASPPYVQIEMEGSTQTQSQTWRPPPAAGGGTTRMPESVRAGLIANLSQWLKQMVVRRLVSDRAQLLATQQSATLKALAVDERLAKIEQQLQQRNQDYERRIDELLKALITAEEENRELIRAQITFLKAEMEKERLKARQLSIEHQRQ